MLHGEDHAHNYVAEDLLIEAEHALRAVLDDVHHESEETLPEVWVELEFVLDHGECACAEALVDDGQLVLQLLSHMFYHC